MKCKVIFLSILAACLGTSLLAQPIKTKNVVLVTLDGLRWQEVFGGADSLIMMSKSQESDRSFMLEKHWDSSPLVRRQKMMPFLWSEIASKGIILGNRNKGCNMNLTNKYWFSYPGYNELFTGWADDSVNSNDKTYNPNVTVFETANRLPAFANKVAAIASWDCFPYILNQSRSGIYVNAGNQHAMGNVTCPEQTLNAIIDNMAIYADGIRYDVFTYFYAFEYLKAKSPRLLFIGFDETDDDAHSGQYIRYLEAAQQGDRLIGLLWNWLQNDPRYKGQTTLIVTCDHGRGASTDEQWRHHGADIEGANQTWMAIIGPDTPAKGEVSGGQFYTNQIAATLARLLQIPYPNAKAGKPIGEVFK